MNDRELIGQAIAAHICNDPETLTMEQSHLIEGLSDAVLAAIGDRLLPELPDEVAEIHLFRQSDGTWSWGIYTPGGLELEEPCATPADAIRNAIEGT